MRRASPTVRFRVLRVVGTGDFKATRMIFDELVASRADIGLVAVNVLISSYRKETGEVNWDGLNQCYKEFFEDGPYEADEFTYNHFLMACNSTSRKDDAEFWFSKLLQSHPEPSRYSIRIFQSLLGETRFMRYCNAQFPETRKILLHGSNFTQEAKNRPQVKPESGNRKWSKAAGLKEAVTN